MGIQPGRPIDYLRATKLRRSVRLCPLARNSYGFVAVIFPISTVLYAKDQWNGPATRAGTRRPRAGIERQLLGIGVQDAAELLPFRAVPALQPHLSPVLIDGSARVDGNAR